MEYIKIDKLCDHLNEIGLCYICKNDKIKELQAENKLLKEKYACHLVDCDRNVGISQDNCTCGLSDILKDK